MKSRFAGEAVVSYTIALRDGGMLCLHFESLFGILAELVPGERVRITVEAMAQASRRDGPRAKSPAQLAGMWCRDRTFVRWLCGTFPGRWKAAVGADDAARAACVIRSVCAIASRAQLDTDARAAFEFHRQIRKPYLDWLQSNAQVLEGAS